MKKPALAAHHSIFTLLLFFCSSCSSPSKDEYSISEKEYSEDSISVQAAVNLAYSAYLKGCVDSSQELKAKGSLSHCIEMAKSHIESNVLFFLEKEPAVKKKAVGVQNVHE